MGNNQDVQQLSHPLVITVEKSGNIRLCLDTRRSNENLGEDHEETDLGTSGYSNDEFSLEFIKQGNTLSFQLRRKTPPSRNLTYKDLYWRFKEEAVYLLALPLSAMEARST